MKTLSRLAPVFVALALVVIAGSRDAEASHFRYGAM